MRRHLDKPLLSTAFLASLGKLCLSWRSKLGDSYWHLFSSMSNCCSHNLMVAFRRVYHDSTDVESVESRFSDMSMGLHGGGYDSHSGSPFKSYGMAPQHAPYPMGSRAMSYERDSWMPASGHSYGWEYGYGSKYSSTGSDTFSVVSGDGRHREISYNGYQPPLEQLPPPAPRQPSAPVAALSSKQTMPQPMSR